MKALGTALSASLLIAVAVVVSRYLWREYQTAEFFRNLHLVACSTSMIAQPREGAEQAAFQQAESLGIDLQNAYAERDSCRLQLAWLLISRESTHYLEFARNHIETISWCEVRVWQVRRRDESLTEEYRQRLLELILMSPTSEARLAAAEWYTTQGRRAEAEEAWFAAMQSGFVMDAMDAAIQLLKSDRYEYEAALHLLNMIRESNPLFVEGIAPILLDHYAARETLGPLVARCRTQAPGTPDRRLLVDQLGELIEQRRRAL